MSPDADRKVGGGISHILPSGLLEARDMMDASGWVERLPKHASFFGLALGSATNRLSVWEVEEEEASRGRVTEPTGRGKERRRELPHPTRPARPFWANFKPSRGRSRSSSWGGFFWVVPPCSVLLCSLPALLSERKDLA
jgi:hypothetical protein